MYELINANDYGLDIRRPLIIAKHEERFGRRRRVFTLTVHQWDQALEILHALNHPEESDAA